MKIWEILKEENVGKKYKDNKYNKYYVGINIDDRPILINKGGISACHFSQLEIMTLEFEEIQPQLTGWERVDEDKAYYTIPSSGIISTYTEDYCNADDKIFNTCNYFSTKEKAEEVRDMNLLQRMMLKFYDEEDGQVNWNDGNKRKYSINYDYLFKEFSITQVFTCKKMNEIYFSSAELAQRCIDEIIKPFMEGR